VITKLQNINKEKVIDPLLKLTLSLGATDVKTISPSDLSVESEIVDMCRGQKCDGYGLTVNCPPYTMKPSTFKEYIRRHIIALVFKFDVPAEVLLTDKRHDIARIVHETASAIEQKAVKIGYKESMGLAAGSCKEIFCKQFYDCRALNKGLPCRFPEHARPSMSGLGINFFELAKALEWPIHKMTRYTDPKKTPSGMMAGMVLIG